MVAAGYLKKSVGVALHELFHGLRSAERRLHAGKHAGGLRILAVIQDVLRAGLAVYIHAALLRLPDKLDRLRCAYMADNGFAAGLFGGGNDALYGFRLSLDRSRLAPCLYSVAAFGHKLCGIGSNVFVQLAVAAKHTADRSHALHDLRELFCSLAAKAVEFLLAAGHGRHQEGLICRRAVARQQLYLVEVIASGAAVHAEVDICLLAYLLAPCVEGFRRGGGRVRYRHLHDRSDAAGCGSLRAGGKALTMGEDTAADVHMGIYHPRKHIQAACIYRFFSRFGQAAGLVH